MIHSYPWYIADWRESETRLSMNAEEKALYRELLDYAYWEGSLPNIESALNSISGLTSKEFRRAWPRVRTEFMLSDDNRFHHHKVDVVRVTLERWHDQKSNAGKRSVQAKRQRKPPEKVTDVPTTVITAAATVVPTTEERLLQPSSSTSTSSTTSTSNYPLYPPKGERFDLGDQKTMLVTVGWHGITKASDELIDWILGIPAGALHDTGIVAGTFFWLWAKIDWFEEFYECYPRHESKRPALHAHFKLVNSLESHETVMAALRQQLPELLLREKKFRPLPATWLNERKWQDEVAEPEPEPQFAWNRE